MELFLECLLCARCCFRCITALSHFIIKMSRKEFLNTYIVFISKFISKALMDFPCRHKCLFLNTRYKSL